MLSNLQVNMKLGKVVYQCVNVSSIVDLVLTHIPYL